MKREINSNDWADFCKRVTRERKGALITVETIFPDGDKREQAANVTLEGMDFDTSNGCNDMIHLRVRDEREVAIEIIDPRHIILEESQAGGGFNPIQIDGENGTTFVTFRPAIHGDMLSGLKLQ